MFRWLSLLSIWLACAGVLAQQPSDTSLSSTPTPLPSSTLSQTFERNSTSAQFTPNATVSYTVSATTVNTTLILPRSTSTFLINGSSTAIPTLLPVSQTIFLTSSTTNTANATATPTSTKAARPADVLDTRVTGAWVFLGLVLILTGLPTAFWGHKNRWSSFFLLGFYTLALVCGVLILKFVVLANVQNDENPPSGKVQALFVFSTLVAGIVGGGVSIFFWNSAKYLIGAFGGLAFGFYIQCFKDSGLIRPTGLRWLMYIGCALVGFTLCTHNKLHYHILLISTALVGASAFMLGVDCFTTAGLKEFYVWNLGFSGIFPKLAKKGFVVSQTMGIELGLIAAIAIAGAAVQLRVLSVLQFKFRQIQLEHRKREDEIDRGVAERFRRVEQEREEWEKEHGHGPEPESRMSTMADEDRKSMATRNSLSGIPLLGKASDAVSQNGLSTPGSTNLLLQVENSPKYPPLSLPMPQEDEDDTRAQRRKSLQMPGLLPAMDLGTDVKTAIPDDMISNTTRAELTSYPSASDAQRTKDAEALRQKRALEAEIQNIRNSMNELNTKAQAARAVRNSLGPETLNAHTTAAEAALPASRVPETSSVTQPGPASRTVGTAAKDKKTLPSFFSTTPAVNAVSSFFSSWKAPTPAPRDSTATRSTQLSEEERKRRDDEHRRYTEERKLFVPPSGVTPSIPTSMTLPSPAVMEAVAQRQRRENSFLERATGRATPRSSMALDEELGLAQGQRPGMLGESARPHSWYGMMRHSAGVGTRSAGTSEFGLRIGDEEMGVGGRPETLARTSSAGRVLDTLTSSDEARKRALYSATGVGFGASNSAPLGTLHPPGSGSAPSRPPRIPRAERERTMSTGEFEARHRERIRELQAPLSAAAREEAAALAAKERWLKSQRVEREYQERKQRAERERGREETVVSGGGPPRASRRGGGRSKSPAHALDVRESRASDEPRRSKGRRSEEPFVSGHSHPVPHGTSTSQAQTIPNQHLRQKSLSPSVKVGEWQRFQSAHDLREADEPQAEERPASAAGLPRRVRRSDRRS